MGYTLALEIGNRTMKLALGTRNGGEFHLKAVKTVGCKGFSSGEVTDRKLAESVLSQSIAGLAGHARIDLLNFIVPSRYIVKKTVGISRTRINCKGDSTWEDLRKDCFKQVEKPSGTEILDSFPVMMEVDDRPVTVLPKGFVSRLKVVWNVYFVKSAVLDSWFSFLQPVSKAASVVFMPEERAIGTAFDLFRNRASRIVVDLGERSVKIFSFSGGLLKLAKRLPVGCGAVERDIATAFGIGLDKALLMKEGSGNALRITCKGEQVVIPDTEDACSSYDMAQVVQGRMEEIFEGVVYLLQQYGEVEYSNIILVGGGMNLKNSKELFDCMVGMDTVHVDFGNMDVEDEKLKAPETVVVVGALSATPEDNSRKGKGIFGFF